MLQASKRYGTQIPLSMTLESRSQVKDHRRYELESFREDVKLFKGIAEGIVKFKGIASVQAVSR